MQRNVNKYIYSHATQCNVNKYISKMNAIEVEIKVWIKLIRLKKNVMIVFQWKRILKNNLKK